jgi:hypothetical protein
VAVAGDGGALVAAAHRDDQVGSLHGGLVKPVSLPGRQVDPELGHDAHAGRMGVRGGAAAGGAGPAKGLGDRV